MKLIFMITLFVMSLLNSNHSSIFLAFVSLSMALIVLNFIKLWNHIFLMLLNLELMGLSLIFTLTLLSTFLTFNMELFFLFFTFAVCEASMGIAILIFYSHSKGSESMLALL